MSIETWEIRTMKDFNTFETEWLWYPYIPLGKVTIMQGDPGEGKTTLALNIAAMVSNGRMFGTEQTFERGRVIYQTAEDGISDTVKPRLAAAGADLTMIFNIDESSEPISFSGEKLEEAIQLVCPKLVILDPLQAYLGANVDMHRANEIRPAMSRLAELAKKYRCAIVLIGHMNKNMGVKSAYRGLGSIDITAAARSVLVVAREKTDKQVRVVFHIKSSLAPEGETVAFRLSEDNGFTYLGRHRADLDTLLAGGSNETMTSSAEDMICEMLADGECPAADIYSAAAEKGINEKSVQYVKKRLGIRSKKVGDNWVWLLPSASQDLKT